VANGLPVAADCGYGARRLSGLFQQGECSLGEQPAQCPVQRTQPLDFAAAIGTDLGNCVAHVGGQWMGVGSDKVW
jgi:hypothetical protein